MWNKIKLALSNVVLTWGDTTVAIGISLVVLGFALWLS